MVNILSNRVLGDKCPFRLLEEFGAPLYVYNEGVIRKRCKEMKGMCTYANLRFHYSAKANSNLAILQIIRSEGFWVDAMSEGEIYAEMAAGFLPHEILFVSNNVSVASMRYAIDMGVLMSVDSLSQLRQYGELNRGGSVVARFNPGEGDGHSNKTITAGEGTKFGIELSSANVDAVLEICDKYELKVVGIHMHVGSLFFEVDKFLQSGRNLVAVAHRFADLEFIDLGGGFGIPYNKLGGQKGLDIVATGKALDEFMFATAKEVGRDIEFRLEPGRFIVAESGLILGQVISRKESYGTTFVGCDIGFNSLMRPSLYGSHHDIEIFAKDNVVRPQETVTVVGNICENSDTLAVDRSLPMAIEGDIVSVLDTGAYGFAMASNYNNILRPAEVLICENGEARLVRRRDTLKGLVAQCLLI